MDIQAVQRTIEGFVRQRDWEGYHTPKNVATALSVEVSELLENFQWLHNPSPQEIFNDGDLYRRVKEETADTMIYLLRFADILNIDIASEVERKLKLNEEKYPAERSRGEFRKYSRQD